jgi:hypothetical protein
MLYVTKELMEDINGLLTPEQWLAILYGDPRAEAPTGVIEARCDPVSVSQSADPFPGICDRCGGKHHDLGDELSEYDGVARGGWGEYCRYCLSEFRMEE